MRSTGDEVVKAIIRLPSFNNVLFQKKCESIERDGGESSRLSTVRFVSLTHVRVSSLAL